MAPNLPISTRNLKLIIDFFTSLPTPELTNLIIIPSNRSQISIVFSVSLRVFPNALMGMTCKFLLHVDWALQDLVCQWPGQNFLLFKYSDCVLYFILLCCDCNPPAFPRLDPTCHPNSSAHRSPFQGSLPRPLNLISKVSPSLPIILHHLTLFFIITLVIVCNEFPSCVGWFIFSLPKLECEIHEKRSPVCLGCPRIWKPAILPEWMSEWQIWAYP